MRKQGMIKRLSAFLTALLMVLSMGFISASAADNQAFLNAVYQEEDNQLGIICTIPGEDSDSGSFEVMLGETALDEITVSSLSEAGVAKTVYCLVDVSGSMKGRMDIVREVLSAVSGSLNDSDNMVIARMGNQITESAFMTDKTAIQEEIESLDYTNEDTDLYSGIISGLKFLQQESQVNTAAVMIVLSDGYDDQAAGSTWEEAWEAVSDSNIPVYTVAPILFESDYEDAKALGSFARNSAGGQHFPGSEDGSSTPVSMTGEEMGTAIMSAVNASIVVKADLSGVTKSDKDSYTLSVSYDDGGGKVYEDSMTVAARDLTLAEAETETGAETEAELESIAGTEETEQPEPSPGGNDMMLLIGGIAAALIAVIIIILAVRSANKKKAEQQAAKEAQELQRQEEEARRKAEAEAEAARQRELETAKAEAEAKEAALKREQEAWAALPRLTVRLAVIGHRDKYYTIELVKDIEMTIGRNARSKIILDAQDAKLSSQHFIMLWNGGSVYVWDGGSKNGTSVNGVVVNHLGRVAVRPGDVLRAGSYEYRLYWEES